jgi:hypothetical protein
MAAVIESSANTGFTSVTPGSPSLVVTKPSGLAVGDYLLGFISGYHTGVANITYSTPSGWTLLEDTGSVSTSWRTYTFAKVADSADVAASNFSFTNTSGGTNPAVGALLRISGFGIVDDSNKSQGAASISAALTGLTRPNALVLFNAVVQGGTSISAYALVTGNPTWTELLDINDGSAAAFAIAYGTRASQADSGDATYSGGTGGRATTIVSIAPQVDNSKTSDIPAITTYIQNLVPNLRIEAQIIDPVAQNMDSTPWQNETRPTTTWLNPDK